MNGRKELSVTFTREDVYALVVKEALRVLGRTEESLVAEYGHAPCVQEVMGGEYEDLYFDGMCVSLRSENLG